MHSTPASSSAEWQDTEETHAFVCVYVCVELGLVLSGGNETLILFYELLCVSICESILNIIPERKFQISWQPTDISRQDWGNLLTQ